MENSSEKIPLVVIGASGHSKVIVDIIEKQNRYSIEGIIDVRLKTGEEFCGYPVLGDDSVINELYNNYPQIEAIIGIGDNYQRFQVYEKISGQTPEIRFATAIHPSATVGKDTTIGDGSVIMGGAVINSGCVIETFTVINTGALLDHDCVMKNFSSLAPGSVTGGNVKIGEYSAISIGAVIKHGLTIGDDSIIGAGSLLLIDCQDNCVMYGSPARFIRTRKRGDRYL